MKKNNISLQINKMPTPLSVAYKNSSSLGAAVSPDHMAPPQPRADLGGAPPPLPRADLGTMMLPPRITPVSQVTQAAHPPLGRSRSLGCGHDGFDGENYIINIMIGKQEANLIAILLLICIFSLMQRK
jgi:hypothetical protein